MPETQSRLKRRLRLFLRFALALGLCSSAVLGSGWFWFTHRPLPIPTDTELFQGVHYRREIRRVPRLLIVHIVTIDLKAPGVSFLVTPGDPNAKFPLKAQTTTQFCAACKTQIAVNGDYFFPFHSNTFLDYYPHVGDPVEVEGISASRGVLYGEKNPIKQAYPTLYITQDNRVNFLRPIGKPYNAISGIAMLLQNGRNVAPRFPNEKPEPCTAIAANKNCTKLFIIMTDGRQPNFSEGTTLTEFAEIIRNLGGADALDMDGGGSEALVMAGRDGRPMVLNSPMDTHIPGRERAVANHLGVFARPL